MAIAMKDVCAVHFVTLSLVDGRVKQYKHSALLRCLVRTLLET